MSRYVGHVEGSPDCGDPCYKENIHIDSWDHPNNPNFGRKVPESCPSCGGSGYSCRDGCLYGDRGTMRGLTAEDPDHMEW